MIAACVSLASSCMGKPTISESPDILCYFSHSIIWWRLIRTIVCVCCVEHLYTCTDSSSPAIPTGLRQGTAVTYVRHIRLSIYSIRLMFEITITLMWEQVAFKNNKQIQQGFCDTGTGCVGKLAVKEILTVGQRKLLDEQTGLQWNGQEWRHGEGVPSIFIATNPFRFHMACWEHARSVVAADELFCLFVVAILENISPTSIPALHFSG